MNVLVVDDSAVMRAMIVRTLRLSGLPIGSILEAGDGAQGLDVLASQRVDLALVDLNMPRMSGEEMIACARRVPALADLPVIVVSTDAGSARLDALRAAGTEFVRKPFTPEALRKTVLRVTGAQS